MTIYFSGAYERGKGKLLLIPRSRKANFDHRITNYGEMVYREAKEGQIPPQYGGFNCYCATSFYRDPNQDHILTDDLRIVQHKPTRQMLIYKQESVKWDFNNACESLKVDADRLIGYWSKNIGVKETDFQNWKACLLRLFR